MVNHIRTRIAPSPTGEDLHIGNAYTALINYVFAKKNGGEFIVRIEDTDRTRLVEGSEQRILKSLHWLGIMHDEGPDKPNPKYGEYRQSDRLTIYKKYSEELINNKHAYYCFCTPARLEEMRKDQEARHLPPMYDGLCKSIDSKQSKDRVAKGEKHAIRLNVPDTGESSFVDLIRGEINFENKLIDDQVLIKSDGYPTYHLGVVVDDYLMEISHVIRGEEWISSTPKHILLYDFFGWDRPIYAHMPLLRNPDKSKLSKRKNPVWVSWFKDNGFLREAIINYLGTLAWSFPDGRDLFYLNEMIEVFKLTDIKTTAPIFDLEKLKWFNKQHILKYSPEHFATLVSTASQYSNETTFIPNVVESASLVQPRINTLNEFDSIAGSLFVQPKPQDQFMSVSNLGTASAALKGVNSWKHDEMEKAIRQKAQENNQEAKDVFMDLRISITGKKVGPPLLEWLEHLGKDETLVRINNSIEDNKK